MVGPLIHKESGYVRSSDVGGTAGCSVGRSEGVTRELLEELSIPRELRNEHIPLSALFLDLA